LQEAIHGVIVRAAAHKRDRKHAGKEERDGSRHFPPPLLSSDNAWLTVSLLVDVRIFWIPRGGHSDGGPHALCDPWSGNHLFSARMTDYGGLC
jgi:hypothetical protein